MTTVNASIPTQGIAARLATLAADIKIGHTVFALPWALLATFMAADGMPPLGVLGLILLCMITARTFAMSMNRLLDAAVDSHNPRTARRAIPSGKLSRGFVTSAAAVCALLFIGASGLFQVLYGNSYPLILSPLVLAFVAAYPLLKRVTALCHFWLGTALGLAPICAWIAVSGKIELSPFLMAAAVMLWTAGFDVIYACQDYQSDLETGTFSIPAKLGIANALWVARIVHLLCIGCLVALGVVSPQLDLLYFIGVGCALALLIVEHSLVKPNDLSKVGLAFFTMNGIISIVVGALGIIDVFVR